jgi:phage nucleotide-binding protein
MFNALIYGGPGVGKTRLGGSSDEVPEMRKVLFLDFEGGLLTLRSCYPNVDTVRITRWQDAQDVYKDLFAGGHDYKTVVIDSLSEAQKMSMEHIMVDAEDPDTPQWRDWGRNLEQIRRIVRAYRDLPMNTIFTCHVEEDKNNMSGKIEKSPYLTGKLKKEIVGFFDEVFYMYMKEIAGDGGEKVTQRLLLTGAQEGIVAKDRSDKMPLVIPNPTMATIYTHMNGERQ